MDKPKKLQGSVNRSEIVRLALALILILTAVYFALPSRGFVSTLPIFVLVAAIVTFFYDEPLRIIIIAAVAALFFSSVEYKFSSNFSIMFTVLLTVAVALSVFGARFLKSFLSPIKKSARIFSLLIALVIFCAVFSAFFILNGNPISAVNADKTARNYLSDAYPGREFESVDTHYSINDRKYVTVLSYNDSGSILKGELIPNDDGVFEDGYKDDYFDFLVSHALTERLDDLIKTVREDNSDNLSFKETAFAIEHGSEKASLITYNGDNSVLYGDMSFQIQLGFQVFFRRDFSEYCKTLAESLQKHNFVFDKIYIFGGNADEMLFQYCLTPLSDTENIMNEVKAFTGDNYISN